MQYQSLIDSKQPREQTGNSPKETMNGACPPTITLALGYVAQPKNSSLVQITSRRTWKTKKRPAVSHGAH